MIAKMLHAGPKAYEFISDEKRYEVLLQKRKEGTMVDDKDWKYWEEKYPLSWNFTKRLRTGQELDTAEVKVEDYRGIDVTSEIVDTGSIAVDHPRIFVTFRANRGTRGRSYLVRVIGITTTAADRVEQTMELEVR